MQTTTTPTFQNFDSENRTFPGNLPSVKGGEKVVVLKSTDKNNDKTNSTSQEVFSNTPSVESLSNCSNPPFNASIPVPPSEGHEETQANTSDVDATPSLEMSLMSSLDTAMIEAEPGPNTSRTEAILADRNFLSEQAINEEISTLYQEYLNFEKYRLKSEEDVEIYETAQTRSTTIGKYIHANLNKFINTLKYLSIFEETGISEDFVKATDRLHNKFLVPALGFGLNSRTFLLDRQSETALKALSEQYSTLNSKLPPKTQKGSQANSSMIVADAQKKMQEIKILLDKYSEILPEEKKAISNNCLKHFSKLATNLAPFGIAPFVTIPIKILSGLCHEIHKIVQSSLKISELWCLRNHEREWLSHLQGQISTNQNTGLNESGRLEEEEENVGHHPLMDAENAQALLEKRQILLNKKIGKALPTIQQHIGACKDKATFEEITLYFAANHLFLDQLTPPLKNKAEWDQNTENVEVQKALALQWVKHQEALAQRTEQTLRATLTSKISLSRKFLCLEGVENISQIVYSTCYLAFTLANPPLTVALSIVDMTLKNLSEDIPFIGLTTLLYPEWKFKCFSIVFATLKHCLGKYYKPNEYTFEGYKLNLEIRWMKLVILVKSMISSINQMILWVNIRLVEQCILQLKTNSFKTNARSLQIKEELKTREDDCNYQIKSLKERLNRLRSMDNALNFFPNTTKPQGQTPDAIENLAEILMVSDFKLFPKSTRTFIGNQLGVELKNENKPKIVEGLKELFLRDDDRFIAAFAENRANYIKA